jgi:hypothetical protein
VASYVKNRFENWYWLLLRWIEGIDDAK